MRTVLLALVHAVFASGSALASDHNLDLTGNEAYAGWSAVPFDQGGTFETWVYLEDVEPDSDRYIVSSENDFGFSVTPSYRLKISLELGPGNWEYYYTGEDAVHPGEWLHVAFSYDQSDVRAYVNAQEVLNEVTSGGPIYRANELQLGATIRGSTQQRFLIGWLDETQVWETIRTRDEIEEDMLSPVVAAIGLRAGWRWEESDLDEVAAIPCPLQNVATFGQPGYPFMCADSFSPTRTGYDSEVEVIVSGQGFTFSPIQRVIVNEVPATDLDVVSDTELHFRVPPSDPGPTVVSIENEIGKLSLLGQLTMTPAILLEGDHRVGGNLTARNLCDPGDGLFAILGLPPEYAIDTPPYDGQLCIYPFWKLFVVTSWPFDELDFDADIPDDPMLSGLEVLFQALIGPSFTKPKDASWTNCAHLVIE